ncbi:MAG: integrase [Calditrichaeota bacterium]|nr:MAG: integrase [Calditrichota bacterium]
MEKLMFTGKRTEEIENDDIKKYLYYIVEKKKVDTSALNIVINALKFNYGEILKKKFIYEVKHPGKDKKLSVVLSKEGANRILSANANIKHKSILTHTYSGRLRVGEKVSLRPEDIDSNRQLIHIGASKGRKERYTLLSNVAFQILREYRKKDKTKNWLFPSRNIEKLIVEMTVQKIFQNAGRKAGIKKNVSVHSLRHSFATHLLEGGIDLRYIKKVFGVKSSKTTEIYTHVSTKNFSAIKKPLDSLLPEGGT